MIVVATIVFFVSAALIGYVVVGYPLLVLALAKIVGRRPVSQTAEHRRVDFLIPAHNEGDVIGAKVANTLGQVNTDGHDIRVLVVSDGSTDRTVAEARASGDARVRVLETPGRSGKLGAMNLALEELDGDIVIFSDANALLSAEAMQQMLRHFEDPNVGGVCGQLTIDQAANGEIAAADGLFWRYDQMMKQAESDLGGAVSAQGSIYALRRALTGPVPPGYADDFIMSVRVVDQGYRLAFEPRAMTIEAVTEHSGEEYSRRVRSTLMGWRGLMAMRHLMNPRRSGLYAWQLISHKLLRRLTPLFLALAFASNMVLLGQSWLFALLGIGQLLFYALAALAFFAPRWRKLPGVGKIMFFVMSNIAMADGILRYYRGQKISVWTPVRNRDAMR